MSDSTNVTDPTPEDIVAMAVAGVTLDPNTNMPIIILKAHDDSVAIPIWIGLVEASAIATELEGVQLTRPMTHDLLKNLLVAVGAKLERVVVCDLKDNTFFATLHIKLGDESKELDSRPSDAIALALRAGAEIFVSRKVIDNSQQLDMEVLHRALDSKDDDEDEVGEDGKKKSKDRWTEILQDLKPEDFGKYKM
ncbi:MAG: bifunctional nuclease family protein [Deltaproteobacteria bacterium]|nr:bifunctional nuclease family protein [Deltaproteobacteria bacterium]